MYEKIRKLAQKNIIARGFLIAFIAVRVFFRLVIKYCSFFNEDGSVNERAKEFARKNRVARYFLVFLIAIRVFFSQIKKHYLNQKEQTSEFGGNWFYRWRIAFGVCVALITVICCDSIINTYAAIGRRQDEEIVDVEKEVDLESKMKSVQEVSFHYTRGVGKKLYEEGADSDDTEETQSSDEVVLEDGSLKMSIKSSGFDGDLYEGGSDVVYPLLIRNIGTEEFTDVRINAGLMQLLGYDEKMAEILQRDADAAAEEQAETESENIESQSIESGAEERESESQENDSEEEEFEAEESSSEVNEPESEAEESSIEVKEPKKNDHEAKEPEEELQIEESEAKESETLPSESEEAFESSDLSETMESQEESESGDNALDKVIDIVKDETLGIETLEELCFSLRPGEEVSIYLKVPEECVYGTYSDIIEITTEESEQSCSIEVPIRVYAREGFPWQTTPDRTQPVISYAKDVTGKMIQITDVFEFNVLESEEYDSGIELVECYLNGDLQELEPELLDKAPRDNDEVATNIKYQLKFKEEGINSIFIRAVDNEGNQSVQNLEVQVVKEEDYHVVMPQKIELTVDPAMAYGNTQIYNLRDFAIENDSIENLLVSIDKVLVTVKNGQEKKCSLNMAVVLDGEEVKNMPVNEIETDNTCNFIITGKGYENDGTHKAYLIFTGMLESDTDEWREGDLDVKIQMKLTEVQ